MTKRRTYGDPRPRVTKADQARLDELRASSKLPPVHAHKVDDPNWLDLQADFAKELAAPPKKPAKDGDKLARKLADAYERLRSKESDLVRAQNAWTKARSAVKYLEKELDKLSAE